MLICDEIQNIANASKGENILLTELVSISNTLSTPLLLIGTNKAARLFSTTFRQSRRSTGLGVAPWDRLLPGTADAPGEWDAFLQLLWGYQWVRNPCQFSEAFSNQMFDYTQGVIDLAIKLFAIAQGRAMINGAEEITPELLAEVYDRDFKLMHPMLEALRSGNFARLMDFDDITPINLQDHLEKFSRNVQARRSPLFSLRPKDADYVPRLAAAISNVGVEEAQAEALAQAIADDGPNQSLAQGVTKAVASLKPAGARRGRSKTKSKEFETYASDRFDARPKDYRRATAFSQANGGGKALERLVVLGMAPRLNEVLALD